MTFIKQMPRSKSVCTRARKSVCKAESECEWVKSKCRKSKSLKQHKHVSYHGFHVTPSVRTYLNKLVFKAPAGPMRRVIKDEGFIIPANSPNDRKLKENIVQEILELAMNDARDSREESFCVTLKNVHAVLTHDIGLRRILGLEK